ncbi:MAG: iron ABC transporter permease [Defluviicoccus sp.]|nr:iron ABC transporter permease [Defluviicoccus sp.]MDG4593493.1 iron ABC transporter permease [Defluviicoccus sp.]MDS4012162.1 iron ABC transporter permease [Defluviicoccus sp.]MDS4073986.1 iron ABC transporter permease [Defluviicoccus sp.]
MRATAGTGSRLWPAARAWRLPIVLAALLAGAGMGSLFAGSVAMSPGEIARALIGGERDVFEIIVWQLRVPRTLLAMLIGASLGLSGAVLQGLVRNPLAEPGLLGISGAAAFGAVVAFYSGFAALFLLALPLGGMAGAAGAVVLLLVLSGPSASTLTLILAGVAVSSLAGALTALALNLSPDPYAATEIIFWMMGSLADRSFEHVQMAAACMLPGWLLLFSVRRALDALSLGEDAATSLGFDLRSVRFRAVFGTAFAVGAAVSVSGTIGFIGLVVPHLLRPLVGQEPGRLLAASALGGALLLTLTDIVVRLLAPGPEIKIGVLTALFGAPFFLVLLLRLRREAS